MVRYASNYRTREREQTAAMREGPDIARIAALIGDPARANMLAALIDGRALTASELAAEAGVTRQTASSHLARLSEGGLLACEAQGRHRYFRLANEDVSQALESLMALSHASGPSRTRTGPRDPALRHARACYNHLAGELGVATYNGLVKRRWLKLAEEGLALTPAGTKAFSDFGIDLGNLTAQRRPLCRPCLDWSERRHHLAGSLGVALLDRITQLKWAKREIASRVVRFTPAGESALLEWIS
jgi:DNA-binding transcriptional ArsR family regulator